MSARIPANGDANAGAASTTPSTDLGLKGRDLITIGIFTALYFALTMIPMFVSGIHPMVWAFFPAMAAILGSVPFMLLCSRVRKPFAILIMGSVMCLITLTGANMCEQFFIGTTVVDAALRIHLVRLFL